MENENSNRRGFIHKLAMLGAAGGVATLLLGQLQEKKGLPLVEAADGDPLIIGQSNTGTVWTTLSTSGSTAFYGESTATSGAYVGVWGRSDSTNGTGVCGDAGASSGTTYGVYGRSYSTSGRGVFGYAPAASGSTLGVYGQSDSTSGWGVFGYATATTGSTLGVYGRSDSTSGIGVQGYAPASSGTTYGVYGQSDSTSGTGVYGLASTGSGSTVGVYGRSGSTSGTGVEGYASASSGTTKGVYGQSDSTSGTGVEGFAGNASAKPIVARGTSGQTANLQEWQNYYGTALSVVDASGKLGVGIAAPVRQVHLQGNNAVFRMDRDANSSAFILVRTAPSDFNTIWKTFYVGVDASGVNNGSFFIGDVGTAVSGPSTKRLYIDNTGRVGIGTEAPTEQLHVVGKVRATQGFITGDITFANGYKLTEDEQSGLLLLNQKGEQIARFDEQGNLHIKGKIMQDS